MSLLPKIIPEIMLTYDYWSSMQLPCQTFVKSVLKAYLLAIFIDIKTVSLHVILLFPYSLSSNHTRPKPTARGLAWPSVLALHHGVPERLCRAHRKADSQQVQVCPGCHLPKEEAKWESPSAPSSGAGDGSNHEIEPSPQPHPQPPQKSQASLLSSFFPAISDLAGKPHGGHERAGLKAVSSQSSKYGFRLVIKTGRRSMSPVNYSHT